MSKKIVFFCIPAHGHTNPTLGVVRELIKRGHQVWYYSYNVLREKIEATGAIFVSCDDYDRMSVSEQEQYVQGERRMAVRNEVTNMEQRLSPKDAVRVGKDLAFSTKILVDTTLALDDKVCEDMAKLQPDCIVADSMAVWGKMAAIKLGIPFVSSTTTFAFNQHSAKIMKQSAGELLKMILSMPKIGKEIKRLKEKGYPVKNVLDIIQNDDSTHTIVYTSPEFQPCSETFSEKYVFVGPSIRPATNEIVKTKEKLIYISMGTVNNDMLSLYQQCIKAFSDTEYQVIISVGNLVSMDAFGDLPEHITVVAHIDQIAVLEKADVFVSHCGMNSVSESLYFGVPLVMVPQTSEQKGVAERVRQLEAGICLQKTDALLMKESVKEILSNETYRKNAEQISESFHRCTGANGAADKILQVINRSSRKS